jgi:shikimate dehydrogenase
MEVSGKTKIIGIFGCPVEHTLSPLMHNAAFDALKLDMCYLAFKVLPRDLPDALRSVRALNMPGVNITVPHKQDVMSLLDWVDEEAAFIGAVNTVVNSEGKLTGYNTDGRGFISSLSEEGISIDGKNIVIIGAGGASRAVSYYLSEKSSGLYLFDIKRAKADRLVNDLARIRDNVFLLHDLEDVGKPDIIINATPLGLKTGDPMPIDAGKITGDMVVCDLVYRNTRFLQEADKKGARTLNGAGMLLWQGVLAFELWTGQKPPVEVMRRALLDKIDN